jgi:hypothetical protein
MARAWILALTLMASSAMVAPPVASAQDAAAPTPAAASGADAAGEPQGEPLPPGAPTDAYELTGWCYGALAEYLEIYDQVKPDLKAIDKMFGTPVKEADPYHEDVAAYRDELKIFGNAIVATEKASPQVISGRGAQAIRAGQAIWQPAEARSRRELARAWLSWGMPDRCDSNARSLLAKSTVLGKALSFNSSGNSGGAAPKAGDAAAAAANTGGDAGALTLAPIAPIVTHDASAPAPKAVASTEPPPASSLPSASPTTAPPTSDTAPAASITQEPPPADAPVTTRTDVAAAAPPSRVVQDAAAGEPTLAPVPAPAAVPAQEPAAAAQAPSPAVAVSRPPLAAPTSDEAQEPVL